ncbi:RHS repeat-associated core domain-containing protein, partial [Pseudomonas brassicacearum]|uniref:RHS repeat-associated core domain-containing protein n=1 Tax=Pseudomonas brassicacearum TaxID=930166 RepID=UPI0021820E9E
VRKTRSLQTHARTVVAEVRYLPGLELRTDSGTGEVRQVINAQAGLNSVRVLHWETDPPSGVINDQYRYNLVDHLNSCTLELADDARIISRETYHPFGETACSAGPNDTDGDYKTIRYSGKERDATGLYYYGFRYYIPWLQRWLSPDPAGTIDGLNLYRMVRNNPIGLADVDGLAPNKKEEGVASARPPVPPRPPSLAPATVKPVVPPRPAPPRPAPPQMGQPSATMAVAPKRPPPIVLPTTDKSNAVLPSYAAGSMTVGSHQLMRAPSGSIIVMRGDNRPPGKIREVGGFFPRDNRGPEIKQEFKKTVVTKTINALAREHVSSPNAAFVSTGMGEESGGYGDTRAFLYRMEIPDLTERDINDQTLGLGAPFKFTPKGRLDTRLLMSGDTLDQARFVAMIPAMTHEVTFVTPIPNAYIVASREAGSNQWEPF